MITRRTLLAGTSGLVVLAAAGCSATAAPVPTVTTPAGSTTPQSGTTPTSTPTPSPSATTPSATTPSATTPTPSATPTGKPDPQLDGTVADDFDVPWSLIFLPSGDALVSERNTARLKRVTAAGEVTTLGEVQGVSAPTGLGEGGLLGIALAPGDPDTVFAYLTSASDNRVVRMSIAGGKVGTPKVVLDGIPTSTHHHGGTMLFDADGMLLVSTGDAEQAALAQDRGSLAGKILRLRPDGRAAPGNPYDNRTWTYGHRNVEGLAFDAKGQLWATEFGDKEADELNLIVKGDNYGWPAVEGRSSNDDYTSPKATWSPTSSCSPAGITITRSTAFIGALQGKCLFSVALDGTGAGAPKKHFTGEHGRLRTVALAPDGALWITTSNTDGRVTPGKNDDKILRVTL